MTTIHDNEFVFDIDGLSEIEFIEQDHCISNGQPYKGVTTKGKTLTVKAGRHNSKGVANWFLNNSKGGGCIAKTFSAHHPAELNFAILGTLKLKINGIVYTAENFMLGQGHFEFNNNWWIGSKDMYGVTWENVTKNYVQSLIKDTLLVVKDIISENPLSGVKDSAQLVFNALNKRKVGSGTIALVSSESESTVGLFLFQMDNSDTKSTVVGSYTHP